MSSRPAVRHLAGVSERGCPGEANPLSDAGFPLLHPSSPGPPPRPVPGGGTGAAGESRGCGTGAGAGGGRGGAGAGGNRGWQGQGLRGGAGAAEGAGGEELCRTLHRVVAGAAGSPLCAGVF